MCKTLQSSNGKKNNFFQDRDKLKKDHLADAVDGLKRYNARRKLKGAVQALAGAVSLECPESDSNFLSFHSHANTNTHSHPHPKVHSIFSFFFPFAPCTYNTHTRRIAVENGKAL